MSCNRNTLCTFTSSEEYMFGESDYNCIDTMAKIICMLQKIDENILNLQIAVNRNSTKLDELEKKITSCGQDISFIDDDDD